MSVMGASGRSALALPSKSVALDDAAEQVITGSIRTMEEAVSPALLERFGARIRHVREVVRGLNMQAVLEAGGPSLATQVRVENGEGNGKAGAPKAFVLRKYEQALRL